MFTSLVNQLIQLEKNKWQTNTATNWIQIKILNYEITADENLSMELIPM